MLNSWESAVDKRPFKKWPNFYQILFSQQYASYLPENNFTARNKGETDFTAYQEQLQKNETSTNEM